MISAKKFFHFSQMLLMMIDAAQCNQNYTVTFWSIGVHIKIDLWLLLDVVETDIYYSAV